MGKSKRKTGIVQRSLACFLSAAMVFVVQATPSETVKGADSSAGTGKWKNPVHHCSGEYDSSYDRETDTTDWSYVSFGNYPQTEVTGEALTDEITGASYDGQGDALVNGVRYRRLARENATDPENFGEKSYRYFKWEPLKWRVLDNQGDSLLLIADKGVDCQPFHNAEEAVEWENSDIRLWLNGTFYPAAFSAKEQTAIQEYSAGAAEGEVPGGGISDKVALISAEEACSYGFCEFAKASPCRYMLFSEYANAMGVKCLNGDRDKGRCYWWLRSPCEEKYGHRASYVNSSGVVNSPIVEYGVGDIVTVKNNAVIPALRVGISYFTSEDGSGGGETPGVTPNPGTETPNPGTETPNPGTETPNPGTETPNPGTETPDTETDTETNPPQEEPVKVKKLSISAVSTKIAAGKKVALKVNVSPANAPIPKVAWATDNKKYATVNSKGVVTTKKAGKGKTVKITATAKDGSGKKASIKIKIMKNAVTKVKIKKPVKTLRAGKSVKLRAEVWINGKNANNTLQWTVSNDKYASVDAKGKVTAKKAGKGKKITVTAASTDGTNKKDKVTISIK